MVSEERDDRKDAKKLEEECCVAQDSGVVCFKAMRHEAPFDKLVRNVIVRDGLRLAKQIECSLVTCPFAVDCFREGG